MKETEFLREILRRDRVIAVVGLSNRPERPSHAVARYLQRNGYRIVPVNPSYAGQTILGETCYSSLTEAARALASQDIKIDMVDVFRRPTEVAPIAYEAAEIGARTLWLQLSVNNNEAARRAHASGLDVVVDRCTRIEHERLIGNAE